MTTTVTIPLTELTNICDELFKQRIKTGTLEIVLDKIDDNVVCGAGWFLEDIGKALQNIYDTLSRHTGHADRMTSTGNEPSQTPPTARRSGNGNEI